MKEDIEQRRGMSEAKFRKMFRRSLEMRRDDRDRRVRERERRAERVRQEKKKTAYHTIACKRSRGTMCTCNSDESDDDRSGRTVSFYDVSFTLKRPVIKLEPAEEEEEFAPDLPGPSGLNILFTDTIETYVECALVYKL